MTMSFVMSLALAAVCGFLAGAIYLAWPRRQTAEEWILHRRALLAETASPERRLVRLPSGASSWLSSQRVAAAISGLNQDLALLGLIDGRRPATASALAASLGRSAALGGLGGAVIGAMLWVSTAMEGPPAWILALATVGGVGAPLAQWLGVRRASRGVRATLDRRLPRLLTGARMLLESGAATPERALAVAVSIYDDPATALLREALRLKEVQRLSIEDSLEIVADRYGQLTLHRLADAFRMGSRYGTQMAAVIGGFAQDLRRSSHADFRERMTRAPVLMTLPALVFFIVPLLVLVLFLVFAPLEQTLGQL